jgi:RNA recognition motif-containing protein
MRPLATVDLLPSCMTDQELSELLARFPGVLRSHVLLDSDGRSLGSAVVELCDAASREALIARLDGIEILGQPIRVSRLDRGQGIAA